MRFHKKAIIISLIFIFIVQMLSPIVLAVGDVSIPSTAPEQHQEGATLAPTTNSQSTVTLGDSLVNIGLGILWLPFQLVMGLITSLLETITNGVAQAGEGQIITAEDIIFNRVGIVDINFFSLNGQGSSGTPIPNFVLEMRQNVAGWYYAIRTIAIIALLAVLIYIAIRMVTSTVGEEKGKYKSMLKDWLVSFALLFVLHYIMMIIIYGNNMLVDVFRTALEARDTKTALTDYLQSMRDLKFSVALNVDIAQKFGANVVGLLMAGITLGFLIMYLKRFIVVAFLMMIAPLITITYAIDKVKDGQSQALDTWRKEFFWTIVIQPFHCLIYLVFVPTSLTLLQNQDIGSSFLAIFCLLFIFQAEDIVKNIFGIKADNIGKAGAATALVAGTVIGSFNKAKSLAPKGGDKKDEKGKKPRGGSATPQVKPTIGPSGPSQGAGNTSQSSTGNAQNQSGNNTTGGNNTTNGKTNNNTNTTTSATPSSANTTNVGHPSSAAESLSALNEKFAKSDKVHNAIEGFVGAIANSKFAKGSAHVITGVSKAGIGLSLATLSLLDNPSGAKIAGSFAAGWGAGEMFKRGGSAIGNWGVNKLNANVEKRRLENRQSDLNDAYKEFAKTTSSNVPYSDAAKTTIKENIDEDLFTSQKQFSDAERKLLATAQRLYDQYEKMGSKDPLAEVLNNISK